MKYRQDCLVVKPVGKARLTGRRVETIVSCYGSICHKRIRNLGVSFRVLGQVAFSERTREVRANKNSLTGPKLCCILASRLTLKILCAKMKLLLDVNPIHYASTE